MQIAAGNLIKKFRKQQGYTQKQLAEKAGISSNSIIKYERGEMSPSIYALQKIAAALDVSVSDIFPLAVAVDSMQKAMLPLLAKKSNEVLCAAFNGFLNNKNIDTYGYSDAKLMQLFAEFLEEQSRIDVSTYKDK